jgi:N6-adenosine-specific RNA methylase IME4
MNMRQIFERATQGLGAIEGGAFTRVIADPPWKYPGVGPVGRGNSPPPTDVLLTKQVGAIERYPCMALDEIKAIPVEQVVAQDAILFMWVTNAFLADGAGAEVVRAWGFAPKTVITWAKVHVDAFRPSMRAGHWFRGASEHIIVGVRGRPKRPDGYPAIPTWFASRRLAHSVKPDNLHEIAETTGKGPYLEMFARRTGRPGWRYWGNEV